MADPKTLVFTVDNPMRDMAGMVLLGATMVSRGHRVLLVPANIFSEAWSVDPDFFLLGYHRSVNDHQIERITGRGIGFAILDTEGGPPVPEMYTGLLSAKDDLRRRTYALCSWGERLAKIVVEGGFYSGDQVRLTGSPRHDFFHPDLAPSARERSREFYDGPDRFIMMVGSAGVANPRFNTPEKELEEYVRISGMPKEWCEGLQEEQGRILGETLELAGRLAREFPETTIVLRPHPFENPERYKSVVEANPNVRFQQGGTVDGLLLRAACIVQRTGTTSIEAALAGIPALSMHWIDVKYQLSEEGQSVIHPCPDMDSLKARIGEVLNGTYRRPPEVAASIEKAIRDKFYRLDGGSHLRVADVLCEGLEKLDSSAKKGMSGLKVKALAAKLARRSAIRKWNGSVKFFDTAMVEKILATLRSLEAPRLAHLRVPVRVSTPTVPLEGLEMFRARSVLLSPE